MLFVDGDGNKINKNGGGGDGQKKRQPSQHHHKRKSTQLNKRGAGQWRGNSHWGLAVSYALRQFNDGLLGTGEVNQRATHLTSPRLFTPTHLAAILLYPSDVDRICTVLMMLNPLPLLFFSSELLFCFVGQCGNYYGSETKREISQIKD